MLFSCCLRCLSNFPLPRITLSDAYFRRIHGIFGKTIVRTLTYKRKHVRHKAYWTRMHAAGVSTPHVVPPIQTKLSSSLDIHWILYKEFFINRCVSTIKHPLQLFLSRYGVHFKRMLIKHIIFNLSNAAQFNKWTNGRSWITSAIDASNFRYRSVFNNLHMYFMKIYLGYIYF